MCQYPEVSDMANRSRREKKPVDIRLTMRVKFGQAPEDTVVVVDNRRLKLVGSAFQYRDRAINYFVYQVLRAGSRKPRIYGRFAPAAAGVMKLFTGRLRESGG
jgi:hypothetical protein